ncbi:2-pyrone-4,6-dicarboxylate hydrolase [Pigmentiphaga litoralis]|uniref:amidohydrolase family protein n=1 Tax=Pigmentiphaga litoralis TaxID=516702 RepID=UPI00167C0F88|nr:amidohydrolase family protein [Pigmentiphaga litoralis]GGX35094.1 2-pyrone-4,6-dicarboxylate hydrolase [Pigmentiphaga litoralis]
MKPCQGPDRATRTPTFVMPRHAVDTHAHVFGPQARFPLSPERSYTPEDCTLEQYVDLLDTLRIDRGVIVHGGAHGTDNAATLDALDRLDGRIRAILVTPPGMPLAQRQALHDRGVRGYRMSTVVSGGVGFDALEALADEARELGWHLLLHFHASSELVDVADRLRALPCDYVLDHLARIRADEGVDSPAFRTVLDLLATGRCWVKLASLYRLSSEPYPHRDMLPLIHAVIAARPDRMIWGTNWPHPIHVGPMPNDGDIVDLIPLWAPDPAMQHRMLVENPSRLYGFEI